MLVIVDHVPAALGFTDLLWKLENVPIDADDVLLMNRQQDKVRKVCLSAGQRFLDARGLFGDVQTHEERFVVRASFEGALRVD